MIVIAHKIQTIKSSHDIVVLDRGTIIERGDYNSLMKQRGKFYELAKAQEQLNEEEYPVLSMQRTDSIKSLEGGMANVSRLSKVSDDPLHAEPNKEAAIAAGAEPAADE